MSSGGAIGGNVGEKDQTDADEGLMRFGAKKQETKKIDDVFGDVGTGGDNQGGEGKKEIKGSDLLNMFDDL